MYGKKWMKLWAFLALLAACLFLTIPIRADDAQDINRDVSEALDRFRATVKNSGTLLKEAEGVLVVPNVRKAALVVGGEWGKGALRVNDQTVGYYKLNAASVGVQAGYKQADFVFLFTTPEALREFRANPEWTAGSTVSASAGELSKGTVDTLRTKHPVVGIAMADGGLMGDVSLSGSKLTRFHPEK